MRWLVAVLLLLSSLRPAPTTSRAPARAAIDGIIAGPDGGAWVAIIGPGIRGAIGHAGADGSFRTTAATKLWPRHGARPDGSAWYLAPDTCGRRGLNTAHVEVPEVGSGLATGPDGQMWMPTFVT